MSGKVDQVSRQFFQGGGVSELESGGDVRVEGVRAFIGRTQTGRCGKADGLWWERR